MSKIVTIVIPAYNEEQTIAEVLKAVASEPLPEGMLKDIVVVDDGSTDRTADIAETLADGQTLRVFRQQPNQGKAAAIQRGIDEARGDYLLIQDADLEYSPSHYAALIAPLLKGDADVVYGSRFKGTIRSMQGVNRWANVMSNLTFNVLFGTALTDINTCYKLFRMADIRSIAIESDHFAFETEVTAKLVNKGRKIVEVPIAYEARSVEQGKKINWPKALGMYWAIIRFRFSS
ncbi:MAG: glycosyltransferase family 2 protein [Candidatus Omnitrophica bacterium]|nr:glycosyltransferase family 2 protein [Candidatus Omnitrophota bacterium]